MDAATFQRITTIYNRAAAGDPAARGFVGRTMQRAQHGDQRACVVIGALQGIAKERSRIQNQIKARDLYAKLLKKDVYAKKTLTSILGGMKQGRPSAVQAFNLLRDVHLQHRASSWTGHGSPRTGHYPMPHHARPGIVFGAETPQLSTAALMDLLAMAQRILAAAVAPPIMRESFAMPAPLPYRAPSPKVVTTTKLPTALVTQQNPMLQGTTMRKSAWMFEQ